MKLRVNDDAYESDAGVSVADERLDVQGLINENTEAALSLTPTRPTGQLAAGIVL